MNQNDSLEAVRDINLTYLMLAQRLLRDDREAGMFRLGLSAPLAELLSSLTLAQTTRLAACDQLLCAFRFGDHAMLSALAGSPKHADVSHTHAAILLAGQPAAQFA
ncbi:flagellar transcriptional regulator FlhD [Burkholderia sp. MR1-5-21]